MGSTAATTATTASLDDGVARPAMASKPKYIFFTDFDGTITLQDTNDYMTDHLGFGEALRKQGNADVLHGKRTFRDSFREMMESITTTPYRDCIALLKEKIAIDPHFRSFFDWADSHNVPVVVLSGGMEPVIRGLLNHFLGEEAVNRRLQIASNHVVLRPGKTDMWTEPHGWQLEYHDDSDFGHDKSLEIRKYSHLPADVRPILFYAGDGVSDLSAAHEADLMFAKAGRDLVTWCQRENVPHTEFHDFGDIAKTVEDIVEGRTTVKAVVAESTVREAKASEEAKKA